MDHTKFIFLAEMTKADHKLSKTFLFYQNIICFDRVMHVLLFCGDVFLLKRVTSNHYSCWGKIWAKLGPMLSKNKETVIINALFSNSV